MKNMLFMHRYKIGIIIFCLLLILISYYFYQTIKLKDTIAILVKTAPSDASIHIGKNIYRNGTIHITPGSYNLEIKKDGFTTYTEKIYVDENKKTIFAALSPESDTAKKWKTEHEAEYENLDTVTQKLATTNNTGATIAHPLITKLPVETMLYSISYSLDPSDPSGRSVIINIDANETYRQSALFKIRQLGFDVTDYNIQFKDYENPFPL